MHGFHVLLAIFLLVPVLEIYLLIKVGGLIGAIPTVALVVFTAVLGALLMRYQGFAAAQRVQQMLARGELPALEMLEGVVILLGGALLLTPGFFTDALGFLCLVPPVRRRLVLWFAERGFRAAFGAGAASGPEPPRGPRTIEGEFTREDEDERGR